MDEFKDIDLGDYTDEEKKDAIRNMAKMRAYQDKSIVDQLFINLRNKGYSIAAILGLLVGGGIWQKDNIKQYIGPFLDFDASEVRQLIEDHIENHNSDIKIELKEEININK